MAHPPVGVVFEVAFPDEAQWAAFRALPGVRAALDAVPDPVNGLLIYRGRAAARVPPRRAGHGRPAGAGMMALPEPGDEPVIDLTRSGLSGAAGGPPQPSLAAG